MKWNYALGEKPISVFTTHASRNEDEIADERRMRLRRFRKEVYYEGGSGLLDRRLIRPSEWRHYTKRNQHTPKAPTFRLQPIQPNLHEIQKPKLKVKDELNNLMEAGFIQERKSPMWKPSFIPINKKKNRQILYFRDMNKAWPKDDFQLPIIELMVDVTTGIAFAFFRLESVEWNPFPRTNLLDGSCWAVFGRIKL